MSSKINISIPKPCHENWQEMSPLEKGRFCGSCQKQVFDFTKSSDREIIQKFNTEVSICGRFLKTQLNRDLTIPKQKSNVWVAGVSGILSFLSLGNLEGFSQEIKTEQIEDKIIKEEIISCDFKFGKKITGVILDENNNPLQNARITNKRSSQFRKSDSSGKFDIAFNEGDEIQISSIDKEDQILNITSQNYYQIVMKENLILEEIYTTGVTATFERKTFFGRFFRSIGNIFK